MKWFLKMKKKGCFREGAPIVLCLALFCYQFASSFGLRVYKTDVLGSNFMPRVTSVTGLVSILLILILNYGAGKFAPSPDKAESSEDSSPAAAAGPQHIPAVIRKHSGLVAIVLIALYIACMRPLGFILSTFLYLCAQLFLFAPPRNRRAVFILVLSAVFSVSVYFLFKYAFSVLLPAGIAG
jgi:putative tricarboxylic transport membrane protein